ncbi:protein O-mannosyl-transferase family [Nannocystaceae bacterium ST9]
MRHVLAIAWLVFVFLLIGASPAHFWLDSGEIAAAGAELGVMHPTGVPGYVPLLHLATLLPIGTLGFRMAVVSSACMAGAVALLVALFERRKVHWALLWCVGLWLPLALTLARNGRVVEIYGFATLLLAATAWGFDPVVDEHDRGSRRLIGTVAAVVGVWGFGDLRLALFPAVVVIWAIAWRRREPWSRWAPLFVVVASLVVLTLPLASARGPVSDWGDPQTLASTWDHVQARSIRESFALRLQGMGMRAWSLELRLVVERLAEDLGPFGLLLAVAALLFGLTRPLRDADDRQALIREPDYHVLLGVAWLVAVELVYAVAINPMGGHDRQTGAPLVWAAALLIGLAIHRWTLARPPLRAVVLPLLICALWIPSGWTSVADLATTRSWAPHAWTRTALAQTPSDALVLSQSDDLSAGITAARVLEGARPDLVAIPAQHLHRTPSEWQLADPRRARVWQAAARAEGESARVIAALSSWRGPVALESPGTAVLAGIDLPGGGEPPLWQTHLPGGRAPGPDLDEDPQRAAIERWRGELVVELDRQRLADALALAIHGDFARSPESPLRWLQAERGYRMILDEVLADHPRSLVGLAAVRDRFGDTDEAIALTRAALERDPERPTALSNLALYLSREPETLAEARELAELAVELAADMPSTWNRLALICRTQTDEECLARVEVGLANTQRSAGE